MVWVIKSSMLILPSMYQSTIFGMSVRAARAAEGGAAPDAAGDQLERARGDLLSVDQLYKKLHRPDLIRQKLAGGCGHAGARRLQEPRRVALRDPPRAGEKNSDMEQPSRRVGQAN
jgi:hypothetical protein